MTVQQLKDNKAHCIAVAEEAAENAKLSPFDRHYALLVAVWTTNIMLAELLLTLADREDR